MDIVIPELKSIQRLLEDAINPDTWGYNDWSNEYQGELQEAKLDIMMMTRKLMQIKQSI